MADYGINYGNLGAAAGPLFHLSSALSVHLSCWDRGQRFELPRGAGRIDGVDALLRGG